MWVSIHIDMGTFRSHSMNQSEWMCKGARKDASTLLFKKGRCGTLEKKLSYVTYFSKSLKKCYVEEEGGIEIECL